MMEGWKLPEGWGWEILDKVAPEDSQQIFPPDYPEQKFNYWGLEAIEKNQFDEPQPNFVPGSSIQSTCIKFDSQHVLYCKLRPYLNKVIVPSVSGIGSTEWVPLKPDPSILERKFLAFYLRSPQFLSYSTKNVTGARMPRMSKTALKETSIPIPFLSDPARSLAEQRRIVARLETLLGEVKALREQVQTLQRDVYRLMESALAEVFPAAGQPLPQGWGWKKLGDECRTTSGGTPRRNIPDYFGGSIPWVKSGELNDDLILSSEEQITEKGLENSNAKIFQEGTLLMAMYGATVGKLGILGIKAATNQAICAIFAPEHILNKYLFWFLRFTRDFIIKQSFGGAQPNISQIVIKNLLIPFPYPHDPPRSLAEQRRIVAYLDGIQQTVREAQELIQADLRAVEQLEQSILAAAFGGEV